MNDYWVPIRGHPKYEVSNLGNVRKKSSGRILKQEMTSLGYLRVDLPNDDGGGTKHHYIHRLVVDSFFSQNLDSSFIRHTDGDKTNNCLYNLEVVDRKVK